MSSFDLLRREIREYIYNKKWPALTKIQEAAIRYISETPYNYVLAAPTASGKTEAAFLPAINSVKDWNSGLKILYISPLIALINDQFKRISELCEYLSVPVTSWHGEASRSEKRKLLANPSGILLITPESIEAMLALRPGEAANLFQGVEWILIDEIHGFLDNNRGIQLHSLTERIQKYIKQTPRFIGMSATLNGEDSDTVKAFFSNGVDTKILMDHSHNELLTTIEYFPDNIKQQSCKAVEKIYEYSQQESMLVFPNSRSDVEYLSVNLSRLGKQRGSYASYFAHHSALTKEMRINAENFAKNSQAHLFTICCTSTLEMGIDIGSVDSIVQYNAPPSVSDLGQRLGRSGRKTKKSILHFIATNPWELLQGLAAINLYCRGGIDRLDSIPKPYDVLAHQVLSLLLEHSGLPLKDLYRLNREFLCWQTISDGEYHALLQYLIQRNYIEVLGQEAITGTQTEELLKGSEFFAHFVTEKNFAVHSEQKRIGELPLTPSVAVGVNIFLAAQVWKITQIDYYGKKIYVTRATDGNPPVFLGGGMDISHEIRQEMKRIILLPQAWNEYDQEIRAALKELASDMIYPDNPYWVTTNFGIGLRTFAGSKINKTLQLLFDIVNDNMVYQLDDKKSLLYCRDSSVSIQETIRRVVAISWSKDIVHRFMEHHPEIVSRYMDGVKYKGLLPIGLQVDYSIQNTLDTDGAVNYLNSIIAVLK